MKYQYALTEMEFLITSTTASNNIITILGEELYKYTSNIAGDCSISNEVIGDRINKVTGIVKLYTTVI